MSKHSYTKLIQLVPNESVAYYNRGNFYRDLEQYHAAIVDYTKAIELKPTDFKFTSIAENAMKASFNMIIILDYTKAFELNPNEVRHYNNRGFCYTQLNHYDEAILTSTKQLNLILQMLIFIKNRGAAYDYANFPDKALLDFEKASTLNPQTHLITIA